MQVDNSLQSLIAVKRTLASALLTYRLMVLEYDLYLSGYDPISLLKNITTPSLVKFLVEDGQSLVVENTYGGKHSTRFATVSQLKISWSILEASANFDVGLRSYSSMNSLLFIM